MKNYFALVHQDPGSASGVSFPDLPGVFSAADSEDRIIPHAIEALSLWAEDEPLPEPSTLEEVRNRADVRAALAEGAYLVSVPLIENDSRTVRANITFEKGLLDAIDETAKARDLTRSAFLAGLARREIKREA